MSTLGTNMDQVNLGYTTNNISIPSKKDYLQRLIESTDKFIRSIRWRTFFFLNPNATKNDKKTFGFSSTKTPPTLQELKEFEDGLLDLVQNIEFRSTENSFQKQLSKDVEDIKKDDKLLVSADKTTNFYKLNSDEYNKLLVKNITKDYKKAPTSMEANINKGNKDIAQELELDDRINTTAKNKAFITLKDHKPNFTNQPSCRLINPRKSEIGKISKQLLERINTKVIASTNLHQWKNTNDVIYWYNNINNKQDHSLIVFDVCEFYASITKELLNNALDFAAKYVDISNQDRHIITHAKESILYKNDTSWCKKGDSSFDVTMVMMEQKVVN